MSEQRNLILAIGLSMAIFMGYDYLFPTQKVATATTQGQVAPSSQAPAPTVAPKTEVKLERSDALGAKNRIAIATDTVHGSINLEGGRLDDITLAEYRQTVDPKSNEIVLLSPEASKDAYFIDIKYECADKVTLPTAQTLWHVKDKSASSLQANKSVVLNYTTPEGILFERTISLDDQFLFTISDRVINKSSTAIKLRAQSEITRHGTPETAGFFILHEGPIGYLDGKLRELDYKELNEKKSVEFNTKGGWLGFTDKYWLVSIIPDQTKPVMANFRGAAESNLYKTDLSYAQETLAPGQETTNTYHMFAGPKKLRLLDLYESKIGFHHFDLAVDFGWFYFLTKPLFYVLEYLNKFFGNFGIAILALTILFKLLMFPLANKSFYSMARMKALGPKVEKLKERYPDDKLKMNTELMELYKREKVNPMSGCLPMLVQAPIFFCLYKVLFVTIEMRHAPFFGWIHDLSAIDPTTIFNLFGLIPWTPPSFLMLGAWPIIMGVTMVLQQKLNPAPADPMQAKMMMIMPIMFTYLLASFPAGLVIYWAWSNVLSIIQQYVIMKSAAKKA